MAALVSLRSQEDYTQITTLYSHDEQNLNSKCSISNLAVTILGHKIRRPAHWVPL